MSQESQEPSISRRRAVSVTLPAAAGNRFVTARSDDGGRRWDSSGSLSPALRVLVDAL